MDEDTVKKVESKIPAPESESNEISENPTTEKGEHREAIDNKTLSEKLVREQIEAMQLPQHLAGQLHQQAQDIQPLKQKAQLEKLLSIARTKGVIEAIHTAKKMDDPYTLDILHDKLVQEGLYKEFMK